MGKQFLSIHVDIPIPLRSDWAEADRTVALLRGFAEAIEAAVKSDRFHEEALKDMPSDSSDGESTSVDASSRGLEKPEPVKLGTER